MNIVLWVIQVILAIKLVTVTLTHGFQQSRPNMQEASIKVGKASLLLHPLTAACTFIAALGLLLPGLLKTLSWITPAAAVFACVLMLVSIVFHIKGREKPNIFASVILGILAGFTAYGRWVLAPF